MLQAAQPAPPPPPPQIGAQIAPLFLFRFTGTLPGDADVRALRSLLQSERLAGITLSAPNVSAKDQLIELLKSMQAPKGKPKLFIAVESSGGKDGIFTFKKGFVPWPMPGEMAAKSDPHYVYLTYQSLALSLGAFGINLNLAPPLKLSSKKEDAFGNTAGQAATFARIFLLAHKDANIGAAAGVDVNEPLDVLRNLLGGDATLPVTVSLSRDTLPQLSRLTLAGQRGTRICDFPDWDNRSTYGPGEALAQGCDMISIGAPASIADLYASVMGSVSAALSSGRLSEARLEEARLRALQLRERVFGKDDGRSATLR
jgi:beta-glucosidase-like glycosyl hydrolase